MNEETVEYPVKLAFLYNFTKFVEWPPDSYSTPIAPLVICIVGHDPFGQDLEGELRTRTAGSHPIEIRTLRPSDILSACHVVFVPVTAEDQAPRIVKILKGSSTLTVGETEGFAVLGGIINFTTEGNKLHFEVNLLAAERAGLKISAKMLALAKIVHDEVRSTGD
ncbi:MAG: YfiR family protein [Candidatus Acidiferrales bacterium]